MVGLAADSLGRSAECAFALQGLARRRATVLCQPGLNAAIYPVGATGLDDCIATQTGFSRFERAAVQWRIRNESSKLCGITESPHPPAAALPSEP